MKNILIILLITINLNSFAQDNKDLKEDIEWFIDTVSTSSNDDINDLRVYVLYIYINDSFQQGYCCGMSYLISTRKYSDIKRPNYYFEVGDDVVLVCLFDGVDKEQFIEFELKKLTSIIRMRIVQKLYPSVLGSFTGRTIGMECCIENGQINRIFYKDVSEVPYKGFIGLPVKGVKISRDSLLKMDNH